MTAGEISNQLSDGVRIYQRRCMETTDTEAHRTEGKKCNALKDHCQERTIRKIEVIKKTLKKTGYSG